MKDAEKRAKEYMKVLIINTDYENFIEDLYKQNPKLIHQSYDQQMDVRNKTLFGSSDFYSYNFRKLNCEAIDIHFNNVNLQTRWAKENLTNKPLLWRLKKWIYKITNLKIIKFFGHRLLSKQNFPSLSFMKHILREQIHTFKPDIILNQSLQEVPLPMLKEIKNSESRLIGQIASPLPKLNELKDYDLILSSLPNFIRKFKDYGIPAQYVKLAFEERVLESLNLQQNKQTNLKNFNNNKVERDFPLVFVGSVTSAHRQRFELLEFLCKNTDIKIWGSLYNIPANSPLYHRYMGEAWGIEMYKIFQRSKMVLNNHIDISEDDANNMRMFEATGCGALLLTDYKANINDLFEDGKEVVTYRSFSECLEKINFYLMHEDQREDVANAGQSKTLRDHTYSKRMEEMLSIFQEARK